MGGNIKVYYRMLEQFSLDQKYVVAKIRTALANGERNKAERLAHTLKGLSGTIGSELLQNKSKELEDSIKNSLDAEIETHLVRVEATLAELLAGIEIAIRNR
jgi:two-component system, sensor histidine kinase and response regulator